MKEMEEYTSRSIRLSKQKFIPISQLTNGQKIIFQGKERALYKEKENGYLYFPSNEKLRLRLKYGQK